MPVHFNIVLLTFLQIAITFARNIPNSDNVQQTWIPDAVNPELESRARNMRYPSRQDDYQKNMQIRINREPSISDYRPHNEDFQQNPHNHRRPDTESGENIHRGRLETGFSNRHTNEDFARRRNNQRVTLRPLFTNSYPGEISANPKNLYDNRATGKEVDGSNNRNMDENITEEEAYYFKNQPNDSENIPHIPTMENNGQNINFDRNNIIKTSYNVQNNVAIENQRKAFIQTNTESSSIKDIDRIKANINKIFPPSNGSNIQVIPDSNVSSSYVNISSSIRKFIISENRNVVNKSVKNPDETYRKIINIYSTVGISSTTDNEVVPMTTPMKPVTAKSGDRWIWNDGTTTTTTTTTPKVDVDDRAAFDGDKCPTGKTRLGNACVEKH